MEKKKHGNKGKKHSEETKIKISEAMLGNLNAEKYNEDEAVELFCQMLVKSQEEKYYTIKKITREYGVSSRTIEELMKRFIGLKSIYELIKENVEINCFEFANRGVLKIPLATLILKTHHNYSDKIETKTDITTGGEILKISNLITFISDDNSDEETDE
ncbi:NUMOD3 domain-containing DNA-binding protein [Empedobacter sp. 189-2]|uniref:NUMOD3 domain-containing DNA-binding protein n=1 Tax=Empedobacter sp. 189-2 TaxID=2746724 RepID=UPI002578C3A9|nr:NUMOD3 domain-containing DNA-binding protein [Empedobacter sp. 189-2]MDM1542350.1 hypothetical protein [Empedobacter sp. 189-2]